MKKYILIILCILCMSVSFGCPKEIVFKFPKEEIQSLSVYTNDFKSGTTTSNWVYKKDDMEDFLYYLENLSETKIDNIDTENLSGLFYGVELHAKDPYYILFAGNYAITYEGEYYFIDGEEAEKMCKSIIGDTKIKDDVSNIVNQRYLSLREGHWDTKYMTPSSWTGDRIENVQLQGEKTSVNTNEIVLGLTIVNNTENNIEFGSRIELETLIDGVWYSIGNMINKNVHLMWTDMLYRLAPNKSKQDKFYLDHYQPLLVGRYRLIKEVTTYKNTGYVAYEFNVE